ncbi:hypothetical protein WA026_010499 [Henosepilachna vigintioctopunctata]|uniref:RING-type domain-containing protein n=1 Tax=Henosepilachna vigintioctopunctata TaxID=420089 RepID=A0AAW1VBB5_9CUCU
MDKDNQPGTSGYAEEARRGSRLKRKQIVPIVCPICGVTLRSSEVKMHLNSEIEKLNRINSTKARSNGRNTPSSSSANTTSPKSPNVSDKDNWEIFKKVRSNRQLRQKSKSRKRKSDEVVCPICNKDISAIAEDLIMHVEMCLRRSESSNDTDENIDVEAYDEYEWAGQSRIRATSMLQGGVSTLGSSLSMVEDDEDLNVEDIDDSIVYGAPQYSEHDVILPSADKANIALRRAVTGVDPKTIDDLEEDTSSISGQSTSYCEATAGSDPTVEVLKARIRDLENREQNKDSYKCLICLDRYRTPVISVCCWHVHCEQCWLQTLGAKKLCPQCNMITSPSDLRKIYM